MKYGILGRLSTESADLDAGQEFTLAQDIAADTAFMDATDIAHESESDYSDMVQAINVSANLEAQEALTGELLTQPESITPGAAALARESMVTALSAVGADVSRYNVSVESMRVAPVQSMEVTHEGVGSTAKKIYEGIKILFKKIGMSIKKLAAKLVVAMNGVGKKAEKMLKAFNANKTAIAKKGKLDEDDVTKIYKALGGYKGLGEFTHADRVANIDAMTTFAENVMADYDKVVETAKGINDGTDAEKLVNALKDTDSLESIKYKIAQSILKTEASSTTSAIPTASAALDSLTNDQTDELSLPDEAIPETVAFMPMYVKAEKIHGVVIYAKKLDAEELTNMHTVLNSIKYANASVTGTTDAAVETALTNTEIKKRDIIVSELDALKGVSKRLKTFSDARMKNIDKITKAMDKVAKASTGFTVLNRLKNNEFNQIRMFVAGNHLSSIFAEATLSKRLLSELATHISYYE